MKPLHCRPVFAAVALLLMSSAVAAQDVTIRGRLIGPDNMPLAGERVLLHRVDAAGGATVAEDSSAADGTFLLPTQQSSDTSAVYFVASRYQGELYIGPPFRLADGAMDQVLQVGVPGTSASALVDGSATGPAVPVGRAATSRSWLLLLIPLLGVAAMVVFALVPRRRMAPERALLIRIAEIDERLATAPDAQRTTLSAERSRLMGELRAG